MKVKLRKGIRIWDFDQVDFKIEPKEIKELELKNLRSYDVRNALFKGQLVPVEGELLTTLKHAKFLLSAKTFPFAFGKEYGKYFKKDVEMDTVVWLSADEVPKYERSVLDGASTEMREETPTDYEENLENIGMVKTEETLDSKTWEPKEQIERELKVTDKDGNTFEEVMHNKNPQGEEGKTEEGTKEEVDLPNFSKMTKDDINDYAAKEGFGEEINSDKMTKKEMISKLTKLLKA